MLSKTIRKNLTDINNLKMRTRATKYSSLFSSAPTVHNVPETDYDEEFKKYKVVEINVEEDDDSVFEGISSTTPATLDEITDYIAENPQEVVVEFPLKPVVEMTEKLPFFKSIKYKLANS